MESTTISISTETILKTIGILLAITLAWLIRDILLLLFSAMLLAGVMYPFATWASRHHIHKGLAVGLVYLVLLALIGLAIGFLIPALVDQARQASGTFGGTLGWLRDGAFFLRDTAGRFGLGDSAPTIASLSGRAQEVAFHFLTSINNLFGAVGAVIIVLVLSFYLVIEDEAVKRAFRASIPVKYREFATQLAWLIVLKLGAWARGQGAISLITGFIYFVGGSLIGVPYPLLLALFAGLLEFVPYLGAFVAGTAATLLAFTVSPWQGLAMGLYLLVAHQMNMSFVQPQIMRRAVGLNPLISIAAFLIGAKLFGAIGAIFAIPVATAVSVAINEYGKFRATA